MALGRIPNALNLDAIGYRLAGSNTNQHYLALDGARGLAAMAVFLYHLKDLIPAFAPIGGSFLAVDLFFLMSGVVIARSYDARLREGTLSFRQFAAARIIRLYPLYVAACVIGATYYLAKMVMGQPDAPSALQLIAAVPATLLLLPTPGLGDWAFGMIPFAPSAWSLSYELWFNLLYALFVPRLPNKALAGIAIAALFILIWSSFDHGTADLGWGFQNAVGGIARFWFSFTLGVLMFRLRMLWVAPTVVAWGVFLGTFLFVLVPTDALAFQLLWIVLAFPVFVALVSRMRLPSLLAFVSDHLGRLSYGIYILHAPVILFVMGVIKAMTNGSPDLAPGWLAFILIGAVLTTTAFLTYFVDEPLRRHLSRRTTSPRASGKAGSATKSR